MTQVEREGTGMVAVHVCYNARFGRGGWIWGRLCHCDYLEEVMVVLLLHNDDVVDGVRFSIWRRRAEVRDPDSGKGQGRTYLRDLR